jgi:polysaccharide export outer membrane protein
MNKSNRSKFSLSFLVVLLFFTTACVPYSKLRYFNDIDELSEPIVNPARSVTIFPSNKLHIIVLSTDQQTANLLNYSETAGQTGTKGYVVDEAGNINFPFVGKINVGNLTLLEAGKKITDTITSIITKPEVIISFMENKITVLGEVGNQGTFTFNEDFLSIYESLSLCGGLTQYADRKKVVLIRKENNKLLYYKLDLTNSKIAANSLYYIRPNDILIAEPIRSKSWSFQNTAFSTITTTLTAILSIITITRLK